MVVFAVCAVTIVSTDVTAEASAFLSSRSLSAAATTLSFSTQYSSLVKVTTSPLAFLIERVSWPLAKFMAISPISICSGVGNLGALFTPCPSTTLLLKCKSFFLAIYINVLLLIILLLFLKRIFSIFHLEYHSVCHIFSKFIRRST